MKKVILIVVFSVYWVVVFAQELIEPTLKVSFTESRGNFLVLTSFDKIGKSNITIDYVTTLRQELNDSKKNSSEQQKQIDDQKREIDELKRANAIQQRELDDQKKNVESLKRNLTGLTRKVEDLQRKVK